MSSETPIGHAVTMPWIGFNNGAWTNAIGVDCDHADAVDRVDAFMFYLRSVDPEAPAPMTVRDPFTGRAHVTWFLERPVYTGYQPGEAEIRSARVLRTLRAVIYGATAALDGDPNFTNRLTKNPFGIAPCHARSGAPAEPILWEAYIESGTNCRFHTIPGDCRPIGLLTLWRAVKAWRDDTDHWMLRPCRQRPNPADGERGYRLFNASRFAVYDVGTSDLSGIRAIVDEQAAMLGSTVSPKERHTMACSIARFMRTRWCGRRNPAAAKRRGILGLDAASLDLPERQALGGKHGAKVNAGNTNRRIASAIVRLEADGKRLTQAEIAAEAGVSERTVRSRVSKPAKQCLSGSRRSVSQ